MDFHVTGLRRQMLREIYNERLILLIGVDVFYDSRMRTKRIYVLCQRKLPRGFTERVGETGRADARGGGRRVCAEDEVAPRLCRLQSVEGNGASLGLLVQMYERSRGTAFV